MKDSTDFPTSSTNYNQIKNENENNLRLKFKNTIQKSNSQNNLSEIKEKRQGLYKLKTISIKSSVFRFKNILEECIDVLNEKQNS